MDESSTSTTACCGSRLILDLASLVHLFWKRVKESSEITFKPFGIQNADLSSLLFIGLTAEVIHGAPLDNVCRERNITERRGGSRPLYC